VAWNHFTWAFFALFAAHRLLEALLDAVQMRHLAGRRGKTPSHLVGKVDQETLDRAVDYNLEKLRFGFVARIMDVIPTWFLIAFGFSRLDALVRGTGLDQPLSGLLFLGAVMGAAALWSLPAEAYFTFGIEQRHGFNRQSLRGFLLDKAKGMLLGALLGGGMAAIVLLLVERGGDRWWIVALGAVAAVQLLILWIYPVAIMPLFNRFTPVEPDLARDVAALAERVGFPLGGVVSMDGSRRSSHSNAFITGLIGARRIVLFDTLIAKLERPRLLAVLAHELGHFRLGHMRRRLIVSLLGMAALFAGFGWLASQPASYQGMGFASPGGHAAIAVFALFASEAVLPFAWMGRVLSRRDEHAADRFAVEMTGNAGDLADALLALTKQNLTAPGSHAWYRGYRNTHPSLRERLRVIREHARAKGLALGGEEAREG
jgi:STE24 endopeptidase